MTISIHNPPGQTLRMAPILEPRGVRLCAPSTSQNSQRSVVCDLARIMTVKQVSNVSDHLKECRLCQRQRNWRRPDGHFDIVAPATHADTQLLPLDVTSQASINAARAAIGVRLRLLVYDVDSHSRNTPIVSGLNFRRHCQRTLQYLTQTSTQRDPCSRPTPLGRWPFGWLSPKRYIESREPSSTLAV